jgi:hypothetical protein
MIAGDTDHSQIVRAIVKLVIGAAILLILQAIVMRLAVLNQPIPLGRTLTYAALGRAAAQTAIFFLLVRFGSDLRPAIEPLMPSVPDVGRIVRSLVWLVPVALAYSAYADLVVALAGPSVMPAYRFVFAMLAGGLLLVTAVLVFRNLEGLTELLLHRLPRQWPRRSVSPRSAGDRCRSCGVRIPATADYCEACALAVRVADRGSGTDPMSTGGLHCPRCNVAVTVNQRFCRSCGVPLQTS